MAYMDIKGEDTSLSSGISAGSSFDNSGWTVTTGGSRATVHQSKPGITPAEAAFGVDPATFAGTSWGSYAPVIAALVLVAVVVLKRKRKG